MRQFHASPVSGLKVISPSKTMAVDPVKRRIINQVYTTNDPAYAVALGFRYPPGTELGSINKGPWTLKIPKGQESKLNAPMSLYTVEGDVMRISTSTPEFVSNKDLRVLNEKKYASVHQALREHGVRVKTLRVKTAAFEAGVKESLRQFLA